MLETFQGARALAGGQRIAKFAVAAICFRAIRSGTRSWAQAPGRLSRSICREIWGFCNALADDILPESEVITAEDFAKAVLIEEGWPEDDLPLQWQEAMRNVFEARYGTSISSSAYEQRLRG